MKKILIIDDSQMILNLAKKALTSAGYEVDTLTDAAGFDPAQREPPDLVLVDINMPQFYGDDIVAYFRAEWPNDAPIYLFSNIDEEELKQRADQCGATGYISKEWGLERLVTSVQSILG